MTTSVSRILTKEYLDSRIR